MSTGFHFYKANPTMGVLRTPQDKCLRYKTTKFMLTAICISRDLIDLFKIDSFKIFLKNKQANKEKLQFFLPYKGKLTQIH